MYWKERNCMGQGSYFELIDIKRYEEILTSSQMKNF